MILLPPTITATADDEGMRLDRWFRQNLPFIPWGMVQRFVRRGMVRVNQNKVDPAFRLTKGDIIRMPPQSSLPVNREEESSEASAAARPRTGRVSGQDMANLERWILYQDEYCAVINKPAGLAVQGGTGTHRHLDGLLQARAEHTGTGRWLLVHRLDRDTSGTLVLAKSPRAAHTLAHAFQENRITKTYWGITVGIPRAREGEIRMALKKTAHPDSQGQEKMAVHAQGEHALTRYRMIDRSRSLAWLELQPVTGRTHQLRVHCASMGTPLLGDGKYAGATAHPMGRTTLHLHARSVDLSAVWGRPCRVQAPLPPHMQQTFEKTGFEESDG
jgi:23S rRNA pseudouridine955/2504/2580 synthase